MDTHFLVEGVKHIGRWDGTSYTLLGYVTEHISLGISKKEVLGHFVTHLKVGKIGLIY